MIKLNDYIRLNNCKTVTVIAYDDNTPESEIFRMPWETDDGLFRTDTGIALFAGLQNQPEGMSQTEYDKAHEGM